MKCERCPRDGPCRGESVPRICELVDPGRRDYRPSYLKALEPPSDPEPVAEYPPLARQAANLVEAAGRFVASGLKTVGRKEYARRRSICEACPMYDAAQQRCRKCGCSLAVKPWAKAEHCPLSKW